MKSYKEFHKEYIGGSDIAALILVGYGEDELLVRKLCFGGDGIYHAYIVDGINIEIGEHYKKVAEFESWMRIYDDTELVSTYVGDKIIVYRAAEMGCIIQLINEERNG